MKITSQPQKSLSYRVVLYTAIGTLVLGSCAVINPINHYASALLLIIYAMTSYFYIVLFTTERNWLDLRAIFSLVWLFTIGLASLRLTEYQEQWQIRTWILLAIAYGMFQIGSLAGEKFGKALSMWANRRNGTKIGMFLFSFNENRIFWICMSVTLIGIACFGANIAIRGYVPFFSSSPNAYVNFYTKFHVFSIASTMISGVCYYCIKTQKIPKWKSYVLYLCILYLTFVFPILIVSRGAFITSALSLTAAVYYLNNERFWVLVCCIIMMGAVYLLVSTARNYSDEQLDVFFEPAEILLSSDTTKISPSFELPSKVAFLYSYLTVSHDNFNEAVQNIKKYSNGVRQFMPFNVILRIPEITKALAEGENYLVRPHLNTVNLIGDAFYDFHEIGVIVSMFIWAFIFGANQAFYLEGKGPFALMALGNTLTPVVLCFHTTWMSYFSHWMSWGFALILCVVSCVSMYASNRRARIPCCTDIARHKSGIVSD